MIPLSETPIYAELKREQEGRGRFSPGGFIKHGYINPDDFERVYLNNSVRPTDRYTFTRAPILKNGRKP